VLLTTKESIVFGVFFLNHPVILRQMIFYWDSVLLAKAYISHCIDYLYYIFGFAFHLKKFIVETNCQTNEMVFIATNL